MPEEDAKQRQEAQGDDPADSGPYGPIEGALGAILHVLAQDPASSGRKLDELHRSLLPAIATRQFRIIRGDDGAAVAYATWALVSAEVEAKIVEGKEPLAPSDWQSGATAMLIDLISLDPKLAGKIVAKLKREVFPATIFKARKLSGNASSEPVWVEVKEEPGVAGLAQE